MSTPLDPLDRPRRPLGTSWSGRARGFGTFERSGVAGTRSSTENHRYAMPVVVREIFAADPDATTIGAGTLR